MEQSRLVRFDADTVILQQGEPYQEMYKILSGKVVICFNHGQPDEMPVRILAEQECFGEVAVLCGQPSIYTAVAYGEVMLLRVCEADFGEFIKNNPNNAVDIMKNLASFLVTLSFNLNQLTGELTEFGKAGTQRKQEIAEQVATRVQRYTALAPNGGAFFTMKL